MVNLHWPNCQVMILSLRHSGEPIRIYMIKSASNYTISNYVVSIILLMATIIFRMQTMRTSRRITRQTTLWDRQMSRTIFLQELKCEYKRFHLCMKLIADVSNTSSTSLSFPCLAASDLLFIFCNCLDLILFWYHAFPCPPLSLRIHLKISK